MRTYDLRDLRRLAFGKDLRMLTCGPWVTNGHWVARCETRAELERLNGGIAGLVAAKRTPLRHLGQFAWSWSTRPGDFDLGELFEDASHHVSAIQARYGVLFDGLRVVRLETEAYSGVVRWPGRWDRQSQRPLGGVDDKGDLVCAVHVARPGGE